MLLPTGMRIWTGSREGFAFHHGEVWGPVRGSGWPGGSRLPGPAWVLLASPCMCWRLLCSPLKHPHCASRSKRGGRSPPEPPSAPAPRAWSCARMWKARVLWLVRPKKDPFLLISCWTYPLVFCFLLLLMMPFLLFSNNTIKMWVTDFCKLLL